MREIFLTDEQINALLIDKGIEYKGELTENEFVTNNSLVCVQKGNILQLCELQERGQFIIRLPKDNSDYIAAINACLDPEIPLVEITGLAGTGKTVCAMSSALSLFKSGKSEIIFVKENCLATYFPLGFVKGDLNDKKFPIFQYLDSVINFINKGSRIEFNTEDIRVETLAYLLGETFENAIVIVDEAQNLTPQNIDLLVTRMGAKSKLIILGDADQIYNKNAVKLCGLEYLNEVMNGSKFFSHIHLSKSSLRSGLVKEYLNLKSKYLERTND